jgi:hypothetical protein
VERQHTFSLIKKPLEQYPSFQSNTGASETSTVYAITAVRNPTRALSAQPWAPSKKACMRPLMSVRLRRVLTLYASTILSRTQSVDVNWSYQTLSSGYRDPFDSRMGSLTRRSELNESTRRWLHDPTRLCCRVLRRLPMSNCESAGLSQGWGLLYH